MVPLLETFYFEVTKPKSCFDTFVAYKVRLTELENDFARLSNENEKLQMRKYFNSRLHIANLLQGLICANRTSDWKKHLRTFEKLLPIFQQYVSISYLRDATFY